MTLCGFEIAPGEKRQVKLPVPGGAPLEALSLLHIYYGWMAVLFAVLSYLIYIAALLCSHLSAFRVATKLRLAVSEHLAVLPLGFTETFGSGKLRKICLLYTSQKRRECRAIS